MQRTKSLENLKKSNRLVKVELQKKKMPHFAHFPRPGESDPLYGVTSHDQLKFVSCLFADHL